MNKLIQTINSPFWAAGILTVILLTTGDYKWWLFGLYVLFAFFGKLYIKNNKKGRVNSTLLLWNKWIKNTKN